MIVLHPLVCPDEVTDLDFPYQVVVDEGCCFVFFQANERTFFVLMEKDIGRGAAFLFFGIADIPMRSWLL